MKVTLMIGVSTDPTCLKVASQIITTLPTPKSNLSHITISGVWALLENTTMSHKTINTCSE